MTDSIWPDGVDRIDLAEVDSTMAEAARRAPDLVRPTWIMAERQTSARGRRGKVWENPDGNFAATFFFRPEGSAASAALRSFLAANALYDALAQVVDPARLALKWPNDVLLGGGKVAGILLESTGTADRLEWLAIGIGVNLAHAPTGLEGAAFPPVSLAGAGAGAGAATLAPGTLLGQLAANMAREEAIFAARGFAPARARWLSRAARLGEAITAVTPKAEIRGIFETVDETGQLVLRTATGQVAIPAADVFF